MRRDTTEYSNPDEILPLILNSKIKRIEVKKGEDPTKKIRKAQFTGGTILLVFPSEKSTIVEWLELIKATLNVPWSDIAQILGVKERTIQRWKKGEDFPRMKNLNKLKELKEICSFLSDYPESLKIKSLNTKDPLTNETPLELLLKGNTNKVLEKLYFLAEGGLY